MSGRTEETEVTPQTLADIITLTGTVIPAAVIATWTQREQDQALDWAAAEHLHASDNAGVKRVPEPPLVTEACGIVHSAALAQLAVEDWVAAKRQCEQDDWANWDECATRLLGAGQRAITGLLVLLESKAPPWQEQAARLLRDHREGVRTIDLFALLGRTVPSREALARWLRAGEDAGTLEEMLPDTWRARSTA